MDFSALAGFLNDLLSADYQNGRLSQKFLPGYPEQQGRAQLAKSRAYDRTVEQAQAQAADREMLLRERANNQALANYNAERGVPMALGPQVNAPVPPTAQRPYPGMGAPVQPLARPYPGMGAPVQPQQQAAPRPAPKPQQQVSRAVAGLSPQDYFELLKSGAFRMG